MLREAGSGVSRGTPSSSVKASKNDTSYSSRKDVVFGIYVRTIEVILSFRMEKDRLWKRGEKERKKRRDKEKQVAGAGIEHTTAAAALRRPTAY